ncbi:MAG: hypothetical protein ACTSU5_01290 [Promethearchaeota archaeon]
MQETGVRGIHDGSGELDVEVTIVGGFAVVGLSSTCPVGIRGLRCVIVGTTHCAALPELLPGEVDSVVFPLSQSEAGAGVLVVTFNVSGYPCLVQSAFSVPRSSRALDWDAISPYLHGKLLPATTLSLTPAVVASAVGCVVGGELAQVQDDQDGNHRAYACVDPVIVLEFRAGGVELRAGSRSLLARVFGHLPAVMDRHRGSNWYQLGRSVVHLCDLVELGYYVDDVSRALREVSRLSAQVGLGESLKRVNAAEAVLLDYPGADRVSELPGGARRELARLVAEIDAQARQSKEMWS